MSRTQRGKKDPGYEWWGKRPGKGLFNPNGSKHGKRQTHKAERVQGIRQIQHDLAQPPVGFVYDEAENERYLEYMEDYNQMLLEDLEHQREQEEREAEYRDRMDEAMYDDTYRYYDDHDDYYP